MQILVTKPGILTSFQDLGRTGYRNVGVPVSGAMDGFAAMVSNILLGNERNATVLELTYGNVEMTTETEVLICCCGIGSSLMIDQQEIAYWKPVFIPAGKQLHFKNTDTGCRSYIAIAGGWRVDKVLGSSSTYLPAKIGGLDGRAIRAGDQLQGMPTISTISRTLLIALASSDINIPKWGAFINDVVDYSNKTIRVLKEQEYEWFSTGSHRDFFTLTYTVNRNSDRMGLQIGGAALTTKRKKQMLSTSVSPGAIQVLPSGSLILLMADCQTTGGYPRIARVAAVDLPVCAQLRPGDDIRFELISVPEAEFLLLKRERDLLQLETSVLEKISSY